VTAYIIAGSSVAFTILLSSGVLLGNDPKLFDGHLKASVYRIWFSLGFLGFLVLPAGAAYWAIRPCLCNTERAFSAFVALISLALVCLMPSIMARQIDRGMKSRIEDDLDQIRKKDGTEES